MGKAARWFKGLFGMNKDKENMDNLSNCSEKKDKKRWSFGRPSGGKDYSGFVSAGEVVVGNGMNNATDSAWLRSLVSETEKEQNKHAIAVAAATAAAADAAVAAAQAAVAVVRLTGQGRAALFHVERHKLAAIKIQSVFRGYLSRKALRALKGLVKLQALVRGYLVRKRATATLHSMQALIRAQASVRSQRARRSINNDHKISSDSRVRRSREKLDECRSEYHSKRLSGSYDATFGGFDVSPKIVEIDTYKTRSRSRRIHTCMSDSGDDHHYHHHPSHYSHHYLPVSSPFPCPIPARQSIPEDNFDWNNIGNDDYKKFATAQNTPRFLNSRPSSNCPLPVTPSKSVCGDSFFRPYSNYPSYMSNTQSFKAKLRSQSAPKQRPETVQRKRLSLNEMMASRTSFSGVRMQRPCSQVEEDLNF